MLKKKKPTKSLLVKPIGGLQIIIRKGVVTLVNLAKGQSLDLTPAQARLLGLEKEAILAEEMGKNE